MQLILVVTPRIPSQKPKEIVVVGTPTTAPTEYIQFYHERIIWT